MHTLPTDTIAAADQMQEENELFLDFLRQHPAEWLDHHIHRLNVSVSSEIDCTCCGQCCRSLMINVKANEIAPLASSLDMNEEKFTDAFLERGLSGESIINQQPCHFLSENKCTVYDQRFQSCRDFPHLHQPNVKSRLFAIFMSYGRCPIIFNVMELLKRASNFSDVS